MFQTEKYIFNLKRDIDKFLMCNTFMKSVKGVYFRKTRLVLITKHRNIIHISILRN